MNKSEFITKVAEKSGMTKKDSAAALDAVLDSLKELMKDGDSVSFIGFGTFGSKDVSERESRNPRSGEKILVPAHKTPFYRPSKALRDSLK